MCFGKIETERIRLKELETDERGEQRELLGRDYIPRTQACAAVHVAS